MAQLGVAMRHNDKGRIGISYSKECSITAPRAQSSWTWPELEMGKWTTPVFVPLEAYPRGGVVPQIDQRPLVGSLETPTVAQSLDTSFDTAGYEREIGEFTLVHVLARVEEDPILCELGSWRNQMMTHGGMSA